MSANYMRSIGLKSLVMSEYGSSGIGKYAGMQHHTEQTVESMGESVLRTFANNMNGVTLSGGNICGNGGGTGNETIDNDTCMRWYFLGALTPFSLMYNDDAQNWKNDPFMFTPEYQSAMINAITLKYRLIPYYYTEMKLTHLYGGSFFQPMYFEFPGDKNTFVGLPAQN
jgi:alpha-glucosidase (family GH31 glycosyl hydrolase)